MEPTDGSGFCNLNAHTFKLTFLYYPPVNETPEEMSHTAAVKGRGVAVLSRCWVSCLTRSCGLSTVSRASAILFYPSPEDTFLRLGKWKCAHEMCFFSPLALRFVRTALNKQTNKPHLELLRYFGIGNAAYFERPFSWIDISFVCNQMVSFIEVDKNQ